MNDEIRLRVRVRLLVTYVRREVSLSGHVLIRGRELLVRRLLRVEDVINLSRFRSVTVRRLRLRSVNDLLSGQVFDHVNALRRRHVADGVRVCQLTNEVEVMSNIALRTGSGVVLVVTVRPSALRRFLNDDVLLCLNEVLAHELLSTTSRHHRGTYTRRCIGGLFRLFAVSCSGCSTSSGSDTLLESFSRDGAFSPSANRLVPVISSFRQVLTST